MLPATEQCRSDTAAGNWPCWLYRHQGYCRTLTGRTWFNIVFVVHWKLIPYSSKCIKLIENGQIFQLFYIGCSLTRKFAIVRGWMNSDDSEVTVCLNHCLFLWAARMIMHWINLFLKKNSFNSILVI